MEQCNLTILITQSILTAIIFSCFCGFAYFIMLKIGQKNKNNKGVETCHICNHGIMSEKNKISYGEKVFCDDINCLFYHFFNNKIIEEYQLDQMEEFIKNYKSGKSDKG